MTAATSLLWAYMPASTLHNMHIHSAAKDERTRISLCKHSGSKPQTHTHTIGAACTQPIDVRPDSFYFRSYMLTLQDESRIRGLLHIWHAKKELSPVHPFRVAVTLHDVLRITMTCGNKCRVWRLYT
eukprot:4014981-Amphidinium_carterae.1